MNTRPPVLLLSYYFGLVALLYLPIAVLFLFSINRNTTLSFPLQGFTFDWYSKLFASEPVLRSARNSLEVAAGSSLVATLLGTAVAGLFLRLYFPPQNFLLALPVPPPTPP